MPRKSRIEYAGAVYHVINRGNYRKGIFVEEGSARAFEEAMFEAVERSGWRLYGYTIMSNHYHLCLETPEPNLVAGMQWLQGTFATRFNRFRGERGHVFQGRYKAIIVEGDSYLLGLLDYIHLNPVRAKICELKELKEYRFSSYGKYWKKRVREGLDRKLLMDLLGMSDTVQGMRGYETHLEMSEEADPKQREVLSKKYCRGWYIGPESVKKDLQDDIMLQYGDVDWGGKEYQSLKEEQWEVKVKALLKGLRKSERDIKEELKGAQWKVQIAKKLRQETQAKNGWIAQRLNMGHPSRITNMLRD